MAVWELRVITWLYSRLYKRIVSHHLISMTSIRPRLQTCPPPSLFIVSIRIYIIYNWSLVDASYIYHWLSVFGEKNISSLSTHDLIFYTLTSSAFDSRFKRAGNGREKWRWRSNLNLCLFLHPVCRYQIINLWMLSPHCCTDVERWEDSKFCKCQSRSICHLNITVALSMRQNGDFCREKWNVKSIVWMW